MTASHSESRQFTARLEEPIFDWLNRRSTKSKRSLNRELNAVLGTLMRFEEIQKQKAAVRAAAPMASHLV